MSALTRLSMLILTLGALAGCGNDRAYISVRESRYEDGERGRHAVSGCSDEQGIAHGGAFAVGAEIDVLYGETAECIDYDWWSGCREYAPGPTSVVLTSSRPDVLAENDHGTWTFLAPGETTLVLTLDGVESLRQTLRAEAVSSLDAVVMRQPAVVDEYDLSTIFEAELAPIDELLLLRSGPGARIVVRPRSASGDVLCGRPPLTATADEGLTLTVDPSYWSGAARAHEVMVLAASADAATTGSIELAVRGVRLPLTVETVAPAELTDLVAVEHPTGRPGDYVHIVEVSVWAGEREVTGASIAVRTNDASDCTGTYAYPVEGGLDLVPADTRVYVAGFCGNDSSPTYGISVVEAPALSEERLLQPFGS